MQSQLKTHCDRFDSSIISDVCQQLLSMMVDLTERHIMFPNVELGDIAIVGGLCKSANLEDWRIVSMEEAAELGWFYVRKLSGLLRTMFEASCHACVFRTHSECSECLGFLRLTENEHLSLRLLSRHPFLINPISWHFICHCLPPPL